MSATLRKLVFAIALLGFAGSNARAADIVLGVLAPEGDEAAAREWAPLIEHLHRTLPEVRVRMDDYDVPGLRGAVGRGEVDFFVANSGLYVEIEAAHGASRIATLQRAGARSPEQALASAVVVRADRTELQALSDLTNRRVMAVDRGAFGGWQLAWRQMLREGVDPEDDLAELRFAGFPMQNIVRAVIAGDVDAGVVRSCLIESMVARGELDPQSLRVLPARDAAGGPCRRSTSLYPDWPFAVARHTPRDLAKRVASSLLQMPDTAGYSWTVPVDYQPVRDLFRDLRIGPYEHLRDHSFQTFLRRNWGWFFAAGLVLATGAIHVVRVRALVRRRTRELYAAMEARDRAETEAQRQRETMDHLARLSILGEMSSMVAHEINQPLAAIGNYAHGIVRRIEAGRVDPRPLVDASLEIVGQAERAAGIMDRIRSFSRKRASTREPVDLCAALDSVDKLFSVTAGTASAVELRCPGEAWVKADRLQVEQVLLNLLKNAHDAMVAMPVRDRRVAVSVTRQDGVWRVEVRDNGPGLAVEDRGRLFEPFFTTKPAGLGLGLAICRSVIEAHGGRLWYEANDPEPGLTIGFDLPALRDEPYERLA